MQDKAQQESPESAQLGVRYYYGLVDPLIDNPGDPQRFSSLYLYFSIPIGVHKGEAARNKKKCETMNRLSDLLTKSTFREAAIMALFFLLYF
ncbi:MAG: hypothetical protein U5L72_12490 [Bacteroidales bacterium]|nr:hypothetical protein [Bacteroidales bacterium]